jgi:pyruvate/2-oxoglutarate dehydrogenase complex dihydrolipoamide acyltransferase (E2) component
MIFRLTIPSVGAEVEEIRVLQWAGEAGHRFETGDLVVELETHKALVEIRAGQPGFLLRVLAPDGDWCKIGSAIALFGDEPGAADAIAADDAAELAVEFIIS